MASEKSTPAEHKDGRLRHIADAGGSTYMPPELRLRTCPTCQQPAVIPRDLKACIPCSKKVGEVTKLSFMAADRRMREVESRSTGCARASSTAK